MLNRVLSSGVRPLRLSQRFSEHSDWFCRFWISRAPAISLMMAEPLIAQGINDNGQRSEIRSRGSTELL